MEFLGCVGPAWEAAVTIPILEMRKLRFRAVK